MLAKFKNFKLTQLLLVIIFVSCTVPDESSVQDTTTTTESQDTTTTTVAPSTTTTVAPSTTTTTVASSTTTTTVASSTKYTDYRNVKLFRASTISDAHVNVLNEYVEYSEKTLFSDPRVKLQNLYPILIVQTDRNNYQSAIDLETEYCDYLLEFSPTDYLSGKCNLEYNPKKSDGSIGLFTDNGQPAGSSISGTPSDDNCCYLFISGSHDLPQHKSSMAYVTIHEMFHIFQISNYVDLGWSYDDRLKISGKISGDGLEHKPYWMEGPAVYFSHLYYSRNINDFTHFREEMRRGLFDCYCSDGKANIIDRYLNGPKLYNVTWESDWAVGYQVGAWFIAYIINIHGEDSIFDFWFKTQNGKLFEENFLDVYGKDYKTYVDEFEDFIRNSSKLEIMSILPSS